MQLPVENPLFLRIQIQRALRGERPGKVLHPVKGGRNPLQSMEKEIPQRISSELTGGRKPTQLDFAASCPLRRTELLFLLFLGFTVDNQAEKLIK